MTKSWVPGAKKSSSLCVTYKREKAATLTAQEIDNVEAEAQSVFPEEGLKRIRVSEPDDLFVLENIRGNGWIARQ